MHQVIYQVLIFVIAAVGLFRGFRLGLCVQLPGVIGMAFAIIAARILAPAFDYYIGDVLPLCRSEFLEEYYYSNIAAGIVYLIVFMVMSGLTSFLKIGLSKLPATLLNSIGGMMFCCLKYLMLISVLLNLMLCCHDERSLIRSARSDDGNITYEVMLLAPALLGSETVTELNHKLQLEEAKYISDSEMNKFECLLIQLS